jgi:hypothetical protein
MLTPRPRDGHAAASSSGPRLPPRQANFYEKEGWDRIDDEEPASPRHPVPHLKEVIVPPLPEAEAVALMRDFKTKERLIAHRSKGSSGFRWATSSPAMMVACLVGCLFLYVLFVEVMPRVLGGWFDSVSTHKPASVAVRSDDPGALPADDAGREGWVNLRMKYLARVYPGIATYAQGVVAMPEALRTDLLQGRAALLPRSQDLLVLHEFLLLTSGEHQSWSHQLVPQFVEDTMPTQWLPVFELIQNRTPALKAAIQETTARFLQGRGGLLEGPQRVRVDALAGVSGTVDRAKIN